MQKWNLHIHKPTDPLLPVTRWFFSSPSSVWVAYPVIIILKVWINLLFELASLYLISYILLFTLFIFHLPTAPGNHWSLQSAAPWMIGESEGKYKGIVKWESVEIAHLVLIRLSVF